MKNTDKKKSAKKDKKKSANKKKSKKSGKKAKKSKKKSGDKKKKGKIGKSTKKKSGKKSKKSKSSKSSKKTSGGAKKGKKEKSLLARQSCTFDIYCLQSAAKYLKQLTTKVSSFNLQTARITKFSKMSQSKGAKFNDFTPVQSNVKDIGGNNISDLRCQNVSDSTGTRVLRATFSFLANCTANINASCNSGMPTANATTVAACTGLMKNFSDAVTACTLLNGTAACTCWNASSLANLSNAVAACDVSAVSTNITKFKSNCVSAFTACRNNATAATDVIRTCNQANSVENTLLAIKTATANANALTSLQQAVNTTTGLSGRRKRRQALSCAEFLATVTSLATNAVNAPGLATIAAEASAAAAKAPAKADCSADQLSALTGSSAALSKGVAAVNSLAGTLQSNLLCKYTEIYFRSSFLLLWPYFTAEPLD